MFDIGFFELIIIAIVALVVIGPEKLPGVARTAGKWFGRMSRFVTDVKADIDRELKQEELKKALAEDAGLDEIKQIMNTDEIRIDDDTEEKDYQVKAIPDEENYEDFFAKDLHPQERDDDYDPDEDEALKDITDHSDLAEPETEPENHDTVNDDTGDNMSVPGKKS